MTDRPSAELPDLPLALCRDTDPESWFPPAGSNAYAVKRLCGPCPELEACLTYALDHDVQGLWGGTSEAQRAALRRQRGTRPIRVSPAPGDSHQRVEIVHGTHKGYALHVSRGDMPACEPCRDADRTYRAELRQRKAA